MEGVTHASYRHNTTTLFAALNVLDKPVTTSAATPSPPELSFHP
jgi:hypothetical protein